MDAEGLPTAGKKRSPDGTRQPPLARTPALSKAEKKVLIIDPDDDIRLLLRVILFFDGFSIVAEAANGAEGIQKATELRPEVVVMDIPEPPNGGQVAAAEIRFASPATKIIAFTTNLNRRPPWADAWLDKSSIGQLPHAIDELTTPGPH